MERKINLQGKIIGYNLKKNSRSKNLNLTISRDGKLGLTIPKYFPVFLAEKFIKEKADWIIKKIEHWEKNKTNIILGGNKKDYLEKKESALILVENRINYFNKLCNFSINRVVIKNQKTRWGSCSKSRNLNFNYKIVYLSEVLADYIIVHELCHLKEMNHSYRFWNLVEAIIPDWKKRRKQLKNHIF